jgi:hypothetical protein
MLEDEYLISRAQQELRAAMGSSDRRVRMVHLELADAYSCKLQKSHEKRSVLLTSKVQDARFRRVSFDKTARPH